jgi:hypothetical protein
MSFAGANDDKMSFAEVTLASANGIVSLQELILL